MGCRSSSRRLEFDLLLALARRPWQVFSREVLLEQVWGYRHAADTRLVNVHVQRLRSKIERDPEHPEIVVTVRGIGYKAGEHSSRSGSRLHWFAALTRPMFGIRTCVRFRGS